MMVWKQKSKNCQIAHLIVFLYKSKVPNSINGSIKRIEVSYKVLYFVCFHVQRSKEEEWSKEEIILDWRIWNNPMFICFSFFNTRSIDQVFYDNDKMVRKQPRPKHNKF